MLDQFTVTQVQDWKLRGFVPIPIWSIMLRARCPTSDRILLMIMIKLDDLRPIFIGLAISFNICEVIKGNESYVGNINF